MRKSVIAATASGLKAEYVNIGFLDLTGALPRELKSDEGFYTKLLYKLIVSIGSKPDLRYKKEGHQPTVKRPFERELVLDVVIDLPNNLEIVGSRWATITWPQNGPSTVSAEFLIRAGDREGNARLKILAFYEHDLLFCSDITMQVVAEGDEWCVERPITWENIDAANLSILSKLNGLDPTASRRLNISVHKRKELQYELLFFIRSGETESSNPVGYPLAVKLTDDEINDFSAKARSALRTLIEDPDFRAFTVNRDPYDGVYRRPPAGSTEESLAYIRAQEMLQDIAHAGHQLWLKLFSSDMGSRLRSMIENEMKDDGAIIQIWVAEDAREFVLPWVWIYPPEVDNDIDVKQFWGYRFVIEQIRMKAGAARPSKDRSVRSNIVWMATALHRFPTKPKQQEFLAFCRANYRFKWRELNPEECKQYLSNCDSDILYFYCHGQIAKHYSDEHIRLLKSLRDMHPDDPSQATMLAEIILLQQRKRIRESSFLQVDDVTLGISDLMAFKPNPSYSPLVFLNMCESAELSPFATENMVDAFVDHGAEGVIGTEMPMLTVFGDVMSRRFFEFLFKPRLGAGARSDSVGRVLWHLRREFLDHGNPLAFAYTHYGDATTAFNPPIGA